MNLFAASLSDEALLGILENLQASGVNVYICLAYEASPERSGLIRRMQTGNISFHQAKTPFVHAKTLEIDRELLFV